MVSKDYAQVYEKYYTDQFVFRDNILKLYTEQQLNINKSKVLQYMKRSEETEQITLIHWCNVNICKYPELELIYHVPNGGKRNKSEAIRLKRAGVKKGVPDLCLPVPKKNYNGLYIEMKYGNGRTSKEQKEWINKLNEQGYKAVVCNGFEEARSTIEEYIR